MYHHSHLAEEAMEEYKKRQMSKVYIIYFGDSSVGIKYAYHEMTIPEFEESEREEIRQKIKQLYEWLDGEYRVTVNFGDENKDTEV